MLTNAQLKLHNQNITGSKIAAILGLSPWESKYQIFARMKGLLPPVEFTQRMKAGLYAEKTIQRWCENEWGWKVLILPKKIAWKEHPKYPFLGGFIDRLISIEKEKKVGEFKNIEIPRKYNLAWQSGIPDYYQCQLYFYMILWQMSGELVACFSGNDFQHFSLERNTEIEEFIVEEAIKFWEDLQADKWPEPDASESTTRTLKKLFPVSNDILIKGTQEQLDLLIEHQKIKNQIKKLESQLNEKQNLLISIIAENDGIIFSDDSKITWKKSKDSKKFDETKFKEENPDLYNKYLKIKAGYRKFKSSLKGEVINDS